MRSEQASQASPGHPRTGRGTGTPLPGALPTTSSPTVVVGGLCQHLSKRPPSALHICLLNGARLLLELFSETCAGAPAGRAGRASPLAVSGGSPAAQLQRPKQQVEPSWAAGIWSKCLCPWASFAPLGNGVVMRSRWGGRQSLAHTAGRELAAPRHQPSVRSTELRGGGRAQQTRRVQRDSKQARSTVRGCGGDQHQGKAPARPEDSVDTAKGIIRRGRRRTCH